MASVERSYPKKMFEFGLLNILLGELRHDIYMCFLRSEWNPPNIMVQSESGTCMGQKGRTFLGHLSRCVFFLYWTVSIHFLGPEVGVRPPGTEPKEQRFIDPEIPPEKGFIWFRVVGGAPDHEHHWCGLSSVMAPPMTAGEGRLS